MIMNFFSLEQVSIKEMKAIVKGWNEFLGKYANSTVGRVDFGDEKIPPSFFFAPSF